MSEEGKRIIVSRIDSIGDVMLTLPICTWLKETFVDCTVIFLGKGYTRAVVEAYKHVDIFEDWGRYENVPKTDKTQQFRALNADIIIHVSPNREIASLAKRLRIPMRIGTSHRSYHLLTCSHRVNFSRKKSKLHEAQLNFELLRPLGLKGIPSLEEIQKATIYFEPKQVELPTNVPNLEDCIILHPKSQGSAREWPIEKYVELAERLIAAGEKVVFTGTEAEGALFRDQIPSRAIDTTGKLTLEQLMLVIGAAKGLVACSTGPLHIAGFSGIRTVGLFSPRRPIHPGRWRALGPDVRVLVENEDCDTCSRGKECKCIENISVDRVLDQLK